MTGSLMGEFDLIATYFKRPARRAILGVGDDCALIAPTPGMHLAISTDMLVEGRHFVSTVSPQRLGHKALAVNLSDLAACGAKPVAFTLALSMPRVDKAFLEGFSRGLFALADAHGIELIGGDTTAGPLTISITVMGEVPPGAALRRDAAQAGDELWVSHPLTTDPTTLGAMSLGDARLALEVLRGHVALSGDAFERVRQRMDLPEPRVALGLALRGVAHAAIDLSDGLVGDLQHVLTASKVGATVHVDALPRSSIMATQPLAVQRLCLLAGGDDYELLFTAPTARHAAVLAAAKQGGVAVTCVGSLHAAPGLRLVDAKGHAVTQDEAAFDHFKVET
jgi:thiamine-monophosphate kinase